MRTSSYILAMYSVAIIYIVRHTGGPFPGYWSAIGHVQSVTLGGKVDCCIHVFIVLRCLLQQHPELRMMLLPTITSGIFRGTTYTHLVQLAGNIDDKHDRNRTIFVCADGSAARSKVPCRLVVASIQRAN